VTKPDPFDEWVPRDYLRDYYNDVQEDERQTIRFFVEQMRQAPPGPVLCFGCGPTLHHVFLAAPRMTELFLADYGPRNLKEIEDWRARGPGIHDWTPFVRYTLFCESGLEPSRSEISERMAWIRRDISGLVHGDAGLANPLGANFRARFATVLSPFCADSATDDKFVWAQYSRNIASLVRPGGLMLTAALRRCRRYKVGDRFFPSADIDELDLERILREDFLPTTVKVEARGLSEHQAQGYSGILLARAEKA
jgi:NNMT/PNMT/TEMT family